jgi:acetoacetyl-CoA synthetase
MNGDAIISEKGELVCATPFPSMPIYFWNDENGEKYHKAYFSKFKNIWTHGDYISINKDGGVKIFGRSDATLNPGGIRIGTSEIYKIVEKIDDILDSVAIGKKIDNDERIILFVKTNSRLTDEIILSIKDELKIKCSPKHVPYKIFRVKDIPYTLNGKKIEIAVKNIINGDEVLNKSSIANPESLKYFDNLSI